MKSLKSLKNIYPNSDIYVIGSGASLNYVSSSFFNNKIIVATNYTIGYVNSSHLYLVAKEPSKEMQDIANQKKATIVMCKHHSGVADNPINKVYHPDNTIIFDAQQNIIKNKEQNTGLERSSSTIVSSIHLAAFMGAKNIILVGHDCGTINGKNNVAKYNKKDSVITNGGYAKWMRRNKVEKKTIEVKGILKNVWDVDVYSLNPFINFNLEGHKYESFGENK